MKHGILQPVLTYLLEALYRVIHIQTLVQIKKLKQKLQINMYIPRSKSYPHI